MTTEQIIGLLVALLIMGIGILGCLLPGLPGTPLVLIAAIAHRLWFGEESVRWWVMALLILMTGAALLIDYLAAILGAQKMGASRWGTFGAMAGLCVGVVVGFPLGGVGSLVGLFVGPFLGALFMELVTNRKKGEAVKAGAGAAMGILAGAVGKTAISVVMLLIFTVDVLLRS